LGRGQPLHDERYRLGEFATAEEAVARCRQIVDENLDDAEKSEGRGSAARLWESCTTFGEDPFIIANDSAPVEFSAWSYARARCEERCGGLILLTRTGVALGASAGGQGWGGGVRRLPGIDRRG
jgi:hypothetical protein